MPGPAVSHILRYKVPAAAAAAWTPASLTGLLAWYSADSGVYNDAGTTLATNTQTVQQWNDKSGNGYHIKQATSGRRPQYLSGGFNSLPTVTFTTSGTTTGLMTDSASVAFGTGANVSCFIVGQMYTDTVGNGRAVAMAGPANNDFDTAGAILLCRDATNNNITSYRGGFCGTQAISLATNYRLGSVFDGANGTTYVNNANPTATANSNTFSGGPGALIVGTSVYSGPVIQTDAWSGPISEVVVTLSAMSSGDRSSLDDYFKTKWGL